MLNASEITMTANVIGYDEKTIKSKKGEEFHICEIYYTRERKKDNDKKQYGAKAESFTYFFGKEETIDNCDIKDLLKDLRDGFTDTCDITGIWNNYKFQPSKIEITGSI